LNAATRECYGGQRDRVSLWTGWKSRRKGTTEQEEMLAIGAREWDRMVTSISATNVAGTYAKRNA
jgi:hypothetical protein